MTEAVDLLVSPQLARQEIRVLCRSMTEEVDARAAAARADDRAATASVGSTRWTLLPPPRRRRADESEDEKLRLRRERNREAAERMRHRQRAEREGLRTDVRRLTTRVIGLEFEHMDLERRLAASET